MLDDRRQDLVQVEARADRLADRAERLELFDLAGQLVTMRLQRSHEVEVAHSDRGRRRERREQCDGTLVEFADLRPPDLKNTNDVPSSIIGAPISVR